MLLAKRMKNEMNTKKKAMKLAATAAFAIGAQILFAAPQAYLMVYHKDCDHSPTWPYRTTPTPGER